MYTDELIHALTNRDELSFRFVLALPKAGYVCVCVCVCVCWCVCVCVGVCVCVKWKKEATI